MTDYKSSHPAWAAIVVAGETDGIGAHPAAAVSGRSAWFVGVLSLMVYLIFAMTPYLLPPKLA